MQFKFFTIPTDDEGEAAEELNKFLRSHKVLEVQQLLSEKTVTAWHFCVKYINSAIQGNDDIRRQGSKIDYKEVLDESVFAVFSRLREIRKKIAEEDGLPVFAVFTNEELANIAALPEITESSLKTIKGIDKKAEKFGKRLEEELKLTK